MDFRLLVDLEVVEFLQGLPKRTREAVLDQLERIRGNPERFADYYEQDAIGRRVEISVFAGFAIHYWIDHADRHVKVLALKPADQ